MPTLAEEAAAAHAAEVAEQEAAAEAARKALRQAATDALRAVLVRPDGSTLTMTEAGLTAVLSDVTAGLVVWTAGQVSLAARRTPAGAWEIVVVRQDAGQWTPLSTGPVRDLADIGAVLAGSSR